MRNRKTKAKVYEKDSESFSSEETRTESFADRFMEVEKAHSLSRDRGIWEVNGRIKSIDTRNSCNSLHSVQLSSVSQISINAKIEIPTQENRKLISRSLHTACVLQGSHVTAAYFCPAVAFEEGGGEGVLLRET